MTTVDAAHSGRFRGAIPAAARRVFDPISSRSAPASATAQARK
ncbi:hypothetical protein [Lysobacter sp. Root667]|nr:hypothetical protein [Lysobacter sp. Root667]